MHTWHENNGKYMTMRCDMWLSYLVKLQVAFCLARTSTPLLVLKRVYGDFKFREYFRFCEFQ